MFILFPAIETVALGALRFRIYRQAYVERRHSSALFKIILELDPQDLALSRREIKQRAF
jgi:hypothetical protein